MLRTIETYYLFYMIYSFIGWIWESVFCSLQSDHKLINRGFLNGPYCPIYGWGSIIVLLMFSNIPNTLLLFLLSGISCCVLEYATSFVMEKIFHDRWWDYSDMRFQLNGRICLLGFLIFGGASVLLIKFVDPFMTDLVSHVPDVTMHILISILLTAYLADNFVTFFGFSGFNNKIKELNKTIDSLRENVTDKIQSNQSFNSAKKAYSHFVSGLNAQQKRILIAFPRLRSLKYDNIVQTLREYISERKNGKH